jgi:hypothetical protein
VLALVHARGADTDAGSVWLCVPLLASAIPIAVLFAARLASARRRGIQPWPGGRLVPEAGVHRQRHHASLVAARRVDRAIGGYIVRRARSRCVRADP